MTAAGIEKKAAVGGGEVSGVVDLAVGWRNGDGMAVAPGITPPAYPLPGETGITAGVGCVTCPGL